MIDCGSVPIMGLPDKSRNVSEESCPKLDGMDPENVFPPKVSVTTLVSAPIEDGRCP